MTAEEETSERRGGAADSRVPPDQRRLAISALIRDVPYLRVSELSERFNVSEVTVRADLEALHEEGMVRRVRGGAVAVSSGRRESSYVESLGEHANEKEAIGEAAAALVKPGASVFVDVGTTSTALARALVNRAELEDVVVLTNALPTAFELEPAIPRFSVIVLGGTLRPLQHSLVDPLASVLLERLNVDLAFIGCTGVHVESGITNVNIPEAEVKRRVVSLAQRRVVLADGSKIGAVSLAPVCPLSEVDLLITSPSASPAQLDRLESSGLAIDVVDLR
jgi:DeoR family transcriptional regulator, aga operon transcriptional repressor